MSSTVFIQDNPLGTIICNIAPSPFNCRVLSYGKSNQELKDSLLIYQVYNLFMLISVLVVLEVCK